MIAKIALFIDILLHPSLLFKKAFDKLGGVLKILIKMLFRLHFLTQYTLFNGF